MLDFVAIDFETSNFKRHSACSVALVVVQDGLVVDRFSSLIQPTDLHFEPVCMSIHGIEERAIRAAPQLCEVWPELQRRISGRTVVAHNASFDISVLRRSLQAAEIATCQFDYFCSCKLAQVAWPELPMHKLDYICRQLEVELDHHNAESDASACADIVLIASRLLGVGGWDELESLHPLRRGYVLENEVWEPPSSPAFRSRRLDFEICVPDGFDIENHHLFGKNVVLTGKFAFCSREAGFKALKVLGATPQKGVTKKTDIVVIGEVDSSQLAAGATITHKHQKALSYRNAGQQIDFLDEESFLQLLTAPNGSDNASSPATRLDDRQDSSDLSLDAAVVQNQQTLEHGVDQNLLRMPR
ncbi:exonuclease domain-containing protein [Rhodopirellula europaea]|nr:exonuclease domain-containing protein [Rhodopirellula sp. UBA1907]